MGSGIAKSTFVPRWWRGLWTTPMPTFGCEISDAGVSVARWRSGSSGIDSAAWKPLDSGVVEASPLRENIRHPDAVRKAFEEALASMGMPPPISGKSMAEAVLIIPDQAARLFVLNFDTFPSKRAEGLPLVKWRLKKSLPFDVEAAAISYYVQRPAGEPQVVAVATPLSIVHQYEAVAQGLGFRPRRVMLSTLASLGVADTEAWATERLPRDAMGTPAAGEAGSRELRGASAGQPGVLVVKYSPPWFTTAVLQAGTLRLFRTVGLSEGAGGLLSPADVLSSVYPSVVYFQDNFRGSLSRGYLCGLGENTSSIAASLESELNLKTSPMVSDAGGLVSGVDPHPAERHFAALLGAAREQQSA